MRLGLSIAGRSGSAADCGKLEGNELPPADFCLVEMQTQYYQTFIFDLRKTINLEV